jgi:predicted RNase H-like nuclease (RuvC/YqgF family)
VSDHEWDINMSFLRERHDHESIWAYKKIQEMADKIHSLNAELDEAKKEIDSLEDLLEDYRDDLNAYQWREDNL